MSNYKKFDLEKAMAGEPVVTRDGCPARIVCFNMRTNNEGPILALVRIDDSEYEDTHVYYSDGNYYKDGSDCRLNLRMAPKKVTKHRVIFRASDNAAQKDFYNHTDALSFMHEVKIDNATYPFEVEVSE